MKRKEHVGAMEMDGAVPAGPKAPGSFQTLTRRQLIGTIVGLQLTLLLAALDQTIVSTAMVSIVRQLNGFDRYAWVTTAYLLTSTAAVPIFGKLSDIYGRKWFLIGGSVLFLIASALCGAAGDLPGLLGDGMNQLIAFRGLQGLGAGIITGLIFTVIGDIFPPAERGKYQGLFAAVFGISSILGPTLGGWLTDNLSWRWAFYVNLPVGAVALAVLYFAFPNIRPRGVKRAIDWAGAATLVVGVTALLLALEWVTEHGWGSGRVLGGLALAAVMLVAFLAVEARAAEPIIPLSLFRNPMVTISFFALFLVGMGMFGSILYIPLFMQGVIGTSATRAGNLLTPMMLMVVLGAITSGQLVSRLGRYKIVALVGLPTMALGMFLLSGMGVDTTQAVVIRNMMLVGIGLGLVMPLYTLVVQNAVPQSMLGASTAATQFFRSIGGTVGVAIFGSLMLGRYRESFTAGVPAGTPPQIVAAFTSNPLQLSQIVPQLRETFGQAPGGGKILDTLVANVRDALVYAIDRVFLIGAILVVIAFVANLFLKEVPLRKGFGPAEQAVAASPEGALATGEAVPPTGHPAGTREPALTGTGHGDD